MMIKTQHLSMGYLPGQKILKDVTLEIEDGSFHFLTGASGAGKSTLLNLLALAMQPTEGKLSMFGTEVTRTPREGLPDLRRKIGTVFQDFQLLEHLTVAENVALPLKVAGEKKKEIAVRVKEMLEWIGLDGFEDSRPRLLSGGQKQRVAIARAVISNPPLILADEPSGNLDRVLSKRLMYLFQSLHKMGRTVIFATHDDYLVGEFKEYPVLEIQDGFVKQIR
jgi:cell division transport system ATP-binding protein